MKVLLLGGTGVIGREVLKLLLARGDDITLFHRSPKAGTEGVRNLYGDRRDLAAFEKSFAGSSFDAVIDLACYNEADARGTVRVFGRRAGQLVFSSSIAAYKRPYVMQPVREDNPLMDVNVFDYGFQKAEMERYLQSEIARGLPITIIRPSQTYGIGTPNVGCLRNNYGLLARMKEKKPILVNGDGRNPWVWTFAPDLAKAFVGVLGKQHCLGEIYQATSDEAHIWDDLYLTIGDILGEKPTLYHLPTDLLYLARPDLFAHLVYEKTYCGLFDNSKIKRDVPEFVCEYSLRRGMEMICNWFLSDESQHVIDPEKVAFEDQACALYEQLRADMLSLRK